MKQTGIWGLIAVCMLPVLIVSAGDDVYDEFTPKKIKVKPAPTSPAVSPSAPTGPTPSFGDQRSGESYYQEDDERSETSFSSSYSDRIRRFHNSSVGFSATFGGYYGGYNNLYGNYYDPFYSNSGWYNPGWNQSYWFTPRPYWDYYNFWNPFASSIIIINNPWQQNWGWCNDPWSNFGWNNNWYSNWNNPWYNPYNSWWTPYCHNVVNNNWGWDYNRPAPVYTPRITTPTNSPNNFGPQKNTNNNNYQYNFSNGKNNGTTINKQQKTIEPKNYPINNDDTYYKPKPNFNQSPAPTNNSGSRETDSGIKVIKKQK